MKLALGYSGAVTSEEEAKKEAKKDDLQFHQWISRRRGPSLELLLALRRLFRAAEYWAPPNRNPDRAHGWNRLVGAGFALWRALPLLSDEYTTRRDPLINVDDARLLLDELVLHNRANYPEERTTRKWMAGFYLNCAEDRIHRAINDELKSDMGSRSLESANKAASYAENRNERLTTPTRDRWTHAWNGLRELTIVLADLAVGGSDERARDAAQLTLTHLEDLKPLVLD